MDGNGRIFTQHETLMLAFIIFGILFSSFNTVIVVKLSFMVAKKLVSTFSDLWAVTHIINTFNFSVIFIGLRDTDLVIFMPPHVARREHGYPCWVAR